MKVRDLKANGFTRMIDTEDPTSVYFIFENPILPFITESLYISMESIFQDLDDTMNYNLKIFTFDDNLEVKDEVVIKMIPLLIEMAENIEIEDE